MTPVKRLHTEGSIFAVPLEGGGYARGVVARMSKRGGVTFGYFFGPRLHAAGSQPLTDLSPASAAICIMFGDLHLMRRRWPVLGQLSRWNRGEWPMPDFARIDPLGRLKPVLVRYRDDDPSTREAEHVIDEATGMPADTLYGAGAVEIVLSKLIPAAT